MMHHGLLCVKCPSLPSCPLSWWAFCCLIQAVIFVNLSDTAGTGSPRLTCSVPASPPSPAWNRTAWVTRSWWSSLHASRCMLMRSSKGQRTSVNCCILLFRLQFHCLCTAVYFSSTKLCPWGCVCICVHINTQMQAQSCRCTVIHIYWCTH